MATQVVRAIDQSGSFLIDKGLESNQQLGRAIGAKKDKDLNVVHSDLFMKPKQERFLAST
jgi:hypothetical protein